MKRIEFSEAEDEYIIRQYETANGAVLAFNIQADQLNREFHEGKPVRNAQSVARRFKKIYSHKL